MADSRVWIVEGGYGLWVVRAASEDAAITIAMAGGGDHTGASAYGIERDEVTVREATPDGNAEILGSVYA